MQCKVIVFARESQETREGENDFVPKVMKKADGYRLSHMCSRDRVYSGFGYNCCRRFWQRAGYGIRGGHANLWSRRSSLAPAMRLTSAGSFCRV
jgi:hypothetical protein